MKNYRNSLWIPGLLLAGSLAAHGAGSRLELFGAPVELAISEVSARTVHLQLTPLDDQGRPSEGPRSTILVSFPAKEKLRIRELDRERELRVGDLRVTVKPQPLTVLVKQADGKTVQELVFGNSGSTNTVSFHMNAPVLGLGEGEEQFDRRGHYFRMRNGQVAPLLATNGATIPVPFLIGTEGWGLFFNRIWGEFDLRQQQGRFLPDRDWRQPFDVFVMSLAEPADALEEFIRLTGSPVMTP